MALESADYIGGLVPANPPGSDLRSQGDDHLRLTKKCVQQSFPNINGPVTKTEDELNNLISSDADETITGAWTFDNDLRINHPYKLYFGPGTDKGMGANTNGVAIGVLDAGESVVSGIVGNVAGSVQLIGSAEVCIINLSQAENSLQRTTPGTNASEVFDFRNINQNNTTIRVRSATSDRWIGIANDHFDRIWWGPTSTPDSNAQYYTAMWSEVGGVLLELKALFENDTSATLAEMRTHLHEGINDIVTKLYAGELL